MDLETFKKTLEEMHTWEREVTVILYLKDIKDLLESICDARSINKKHYN